MAAASTVAATKKKRKKKGPAKSRHPASSAYPLHDLVAASADRGLSDRGRELAAKAMAAATGDAPSSRAGFVAYVDC